MTHIEALTTFVVGEDVQDGGVAQMVERMLSMHEAQGSIPCSSTFFAHMGSEKENHSDQSNTEPRGDTRGIPKKELP